MDKLISRIDLDQITNSTVARWIVFFIALSALAMLDLDYGRIIYVSNESGLPHVYVRPYPKINGGKWQVSKQSGLMPLWNASSNELFHETNDFKQMRVGYTVGQEDSEGKPKVFELEVPNQMFNRATDRNGATRPTWAYSLSRDQFLILRREGTGDATEQVLNAQTNITMIDGWYSELSVLAPAVPN